MPVYILCFEEKCKAVRPYVPLFWKRVFHVFNMNINNGIYINVVFNAGEMEKNVPKRHTAVFNGKKEAAVVIIGIVLQPWPVV